MLLSLKWLREFVPVEAGAQEVGDRLTMLGLELEDIIHPYDAIKDIVVGHVLTKEAHPDSDHLAVCTVDAGQEEVLNIVCGAPNVAAGQKVPVALVGTTMPGGMVIKKAKLRGVPSFGMICSERELGLSEDHNGIMVLPEGFKVGTRLIDALDLDTDILEIGITPNRGDCLSVLGLARSGIGVQAASDAAQGARGGTGFGLGVGMGHEYPESRPVPVLPAASRGRCDHQAVAHVDAPPSARCGRPPHFQHRGRYQLYFDGAGAAAARL